MSERKSHVGKTSAQRLSYGRYIKNLDYEPTIDESIDFKSTEKGGEELSKSTARRSPRSRTKKVFINNLKEHFGEHWTTWFIGALVILGLYIVNESRVTIAIMSNTLTDNIKTIDIVKSDMKNLDNKVTTIEMQSALNSKDIEYLKVKK
jgi:hypothetical protein